MPNGNTSGVAVCESSSPWVVSSGSYPTQASLQTTNSYDSAGEQVSVTTPGTSAAPTGATTSSTYDAVGNVLTTTDPDGVTTTYTYTPLGLKASASYSGSSAPSVSYTYDADGRKTGMTDATGTSSYVYSPYGLLTSNTNGAGQTTAYGYDNDGNVTSITYPLPSAAIWATSDTVTYTYTPADRLSTATDFQGNTVTVTDSADGQPSSETLGTTGDTITTQYDGNDMPSAITLANSGGTLQSFSYSDAPSGAIQSETDVPSSTSASYTYDAQSRVTGMTPGTGTAHAYSYDSSGDLTTSPAGTSSYDNAGELLSSTASGTTTSYTYNADGQQLMAVQGTNTISSANWNGAGQLTAYGNGTADMTSVAYDGDGVRMSSAATPTGGSSATSDYVWALTGNVPTLLMDSVNAYIYGPGHAPTEQVNLSTGTLTYLLADALGSVRGTVDATGALTASTAYDAWGNPETPSGLTAQTPFGYAAGYTDPTGLVYLLNRYYDPATGQFLSVDPDLSKTLQPYEYAGDNPVLNTDPTGKFLVGYAYCGGLGYTGYCDLILDEYGSEALIRILERLSPWTDACKELTEKVFDGTWADVINAICTLLGGAAEILAEYFKWVWDQCKFPGTINGLEFYGLWWRYGWWWWGWHWSRKYFYSGWVSCWWWP
jgi:RHS repeat-associated protein